MIHEFAEVSPGVSVGRGTAIWERARVREGAIDLSDGEELQVDATVVATPATVVPGLVGTLCPAEDQFFAQCRYHPRVTLAATRTGAPSPQTGATS